MRGRNRKTATEADVIQAAAQRFFAGAGSPDDAEFGIGDDAAVINPRESPGARRQRQLIMTDMMLEGVHFDLRYMSLRDVGWKALAVNVSDRAAMGGLAGFAVGNLGIPPGATVGEVEELLDGVSACAGEYGVRIVGGDTIASPQWIVGFTLVAGAAGGKVLLRGGAQPGEELLHGHPVQANTLGLSQVGLHLFWGRLRQAPALLNRADSAAACACHRLPRPQDSLGRWLAESRAATACIDTSDSLAQSALHIAKASNVGLKLDFAGYPFSSIVLKFAAACRRHAGGNGDGDGVGGFTVPGEYCPDGLPQRHASLAAFLLSCSEDYLLVFTVPRGKKSLVRSTAPDGAVKFGTTTEPGEGCRYIDETGAARLLVPMGWQHR